MSNSPSKDQARQFALMLASGAPAGEAIRYFLPEDASENVGVAFIQNMTDRWMRDPGVQTEILRLQGADWSIMTAEEKIKYAIDKTYTEMAYFLYSRNYVDLSGAEKSKADTCRTALEAKLAGTAGKLSKVEEFWLDIQSGKIKLGGTGAQPQPSH